MSHRSNLARAALLLGAAAGAAAAAAATRRVERVVVSGGSMLPTLADGDRLLVVRGETAAVRAGDVVVLDDPRAPGRPLVKRVIAVADGRVTVRGDNPDGSTDSRHWGAVPLRALRGRAVYRYYPPARVGPLTRRGPVAVEQVWAGRVP
jgi:nickel-type superoxide dismutase maturation protease